MRIELGGYHATTEQLPLAQLVQVKIGNLSRAQIAQFPLMDRVIFAVKVCSDGIFQK